MYITVDNDTCIYKTLRQKISIISVICEGFVTYGPPSSYPGTYFSPGKATSLVKTEHNFKN